jgi:hypothetical protein
LVIGQIVGGDVHVDEPPYVHIRKSGLRY